MNYRQYITKSRSGHYTLTLKDLDSGLKVSSGHWNCPEEARANSLSDLESSLACLIKTRDAYISARMR